jgi:hypothetical protein
MFVFKNIGEHGLKRRSLILVENLGEKDDAVIKLGVVELPVVVQMTIFFSACLLEGSVEHLDSVMI